MSTTWIGGNSHEPDYYTYTRKKGTLIPRKWFWNKPKTKWETETTIITRDAYVFLNKYEQEKCKPATKAELKKYKRNF